MNIWYFILFLLFFIAIPYYFISKQRVRKYKNLAHNIGGIYEPCGTFQIGKIKGVLNGRKFTIQPIEVGQRAAETHLRTFITIECDNKGMLLLIKPKFFKTFPNWKYISKLKEKEKGSDFLSKMLNSDYKYNSYGREVAFDFDQSRKILIEKKLSKLPIAPNSIYEKIKKAFKFPSLIQIERDKVTLDIGELQMEQIKIEEYLFFIENLAKTIEREPVPL
jgi:hypothetical protein